MDIEKLERNFNLCTEYLQAGNNYFQSNLYHAAIKEFTKVIAFVPDAIDMATKGDKLVHPLVLITYLRNAQVAFMGRAGCYLAIGESKKAQTDNEMNKKIADLIEGLNSAVKSAQEEKKEEEGSTLGGCLSIIFFIIIIYSWLR